MPGGEISDLLLMRPRRLVGHEDTEDGRVVVLRPRFMRGPLAWWLQPRLTRPHFRVKLDEIGSFVWSRCDGHRTVGDIAAAMERQFGESAEKAAERLNMFLGELCRGGMIEMDRPNKK